MQARSSITITAAAPSCEPDSATELKPSGVSSRSGVIMVGDEPPGMLASSSRPPGMPPPMPSVRLRLAQAALDHSVRVGEHDLAILERARLRLVGVDAQVGRLAGSLGQEARLPAHREPGAAAAAEVRGKQLLDHLLRLHLDGLRE